MTLRPSSYLLTACLALALMVSSPARAQQNQTLDQPQPAPAATEQNTEQKPIESRAQQIANEQAAKVPLLKPYEPNRGERLVLRAEESFVNPPPVYLWLGSIYPGGLLAAGVGARKPMGDTALFDVHGGWSLRNYKGGQALFRLPELASRRVRVELKASGFDAPSVRFYGLGRDSRKEDRSTFGFRPLTLGGTVAVKPDPRVTVGGGIDYLKIWTSGGDASNSIYQRFTVLTAPGLGSDPEYVRSQLFAGYDWRTSPGYTDRGGWYHAEWYDYQRRDEGVGDFRRLDVEARQFFPILRANWVIALRGAVSTTYTDNGEAVPFFLTPDLGGADELRGYPAFRFRDRNRILTSAEYRWKAGQFVDMALFTDMGKVTADRGDLNFKGLTKTYGVGVRFHAPTATVLRVEVAKTREGLALVVAGGQIF